MTKEILIAKLKAAGVNPGVATWLEILDVVESALIEEKGPLIKGDDYWANMDAEDDYYSTITARAERWIKVIDKAEYTMNMETLTKGDKVFFSARLSGGIEYSGHATFEEYTNHDEDGTPTEALILIDGHDYYRHAHPTELI